MAEESGRGWAEILRPPPGTQPVLTAVEHKDKCSTYPRAPLVLSSDWKAIAINHPPGVGGGAEGGLLGPHRSCALASAGGGTSHGIWPDQLLSVKLSPLTPLWRRVSAGQILPSISKCHCVVKIKSDINLFFFMRASCGSLTLRVLFIAHWSLADLIQMSQITPRCSLWDSEHMKRELNDHPGLWSSPLISLKCFELKQFHKMKYGHDMKSLL
jgi:hypothetical protein